MGAAEEALWRDRSMQLHINVNGTGIFERRSVDDFLQATPSSDDQNATSSAWLKYDGDNFAYRIVNTLTFDANNDGLVDIFLVRKYFRNSLLINTGGCTFIEQYVDGTINSPEHAHAVALDVEQDGDLDVFIVGFGFNNMVRATGPSERASDTQEHTQTHTLREKRRGGERHANAARHTH